MPNLSECITQQTRYFEDALQRAVEIFLLGHSRTPKPEPDPLTAAQIERQASAWAACVPDDPAERAEAIHDLAKAYGLNPAKMPATAAALGLNNPAVSQAYAARYGVSVAEMLARAPRPHRPRYHSVLSWVNPFDYEQLVAAMRHISLPSGAVLFREGDAPDDGMYVVSSGRMQVSITGEDGAPRVVAERGRDTILGEMALLTDEARTATLTAARDTELYQISRDAFETVLAEYPQIMLQITRMIARRLTLTTRRSTPPETVTTVALVPAGGGGDVRDFAQRLATAFAAYGRVAHLNSARLGAISGHDSRLVGWLSEQEDAHEFVIYEADPTHTPWTGRCLRQADRVLLVGHADGDPAPNAIEQALFDQPPTQALQDLVLLHPPGTTPHNTARWLAARPVNDFHHIAPDDPTHLARLARLLRGRPVALVLSGGSIRAFAHIGVLRALEEGGFPVDMLGATSAGAIIGAQYARGWDVDALTQRNAASFQKASALLDYTLPLTSLIAARRFDALLAEMFGELAIEDLWRKYFCTAVDLTAARLLMLQRGPLRRAVRASCTMPVIMPPWLEDGHLLVDGGLMNNIPVNQMLSLAEHSYIIVVNVTNPFYTADKAYNYGANLPWWKLINGRLNPFSEKLVAPALGNILLRSLEIGTKASEAEQIARADVYIRPDVAGIGATDAATIPALIEAGYRAAVAQLDGLTPPT